MKLSKEEFVDLAKNNPAEAFALVWDVLDAAELNQALLLGADDDAGDATEADLVSQ